MPQVWRVLTFCQTGLLNINKDSPQQPLLVEQTGMERYGKIPSAQQLLNQCLLNNSAEAKDEMKVKSPMIPAAPSYLSPGPSIQPPHCMTLDFTIHITVWITSLPWSCAVHSCCSCGWRHLLFRVLNKHSIHFSTFLLLSLWLLEKSLSSPSVEASLKQPLL